MTFEQPSEDDALTKSICRGCFDLLNSFYAFKQLCVSSNETLLERLDSKAKLRNAPEVKPPVEPKEEDVKQEEEDFDDCAYDDDFQADDDSDEEWKPKTALPLKFFTGEVEKLEGQEVDPVTLQPLLQVKRRNGRPPKVGKQKKVVKERGKRIHSCTICGRKFARLYSLDEHVLMVHKGLSRVNANKCHLCDKMFTTRRHLIRHQNLHHNISKDDIKCECGSTFESRMALKIHQRTHQKALCRICPVCGKSVKPKNYPSHMKSHRGPPIKKEEVSVQCDKCGKNFHSRPALIFHMHKHGERKFSCAVCGFKFFDKFALRKHLVIHMDVKPNKCDICNKRYARKEYLIKHMRSHTGERPFECDHCRMAFTSKERLIEHTRVHTGEKPYDCHICGHCFTQLGTYQRHLRQVHHREPKEVARERLLVLNKIMVLNKNRT